MALSINQNYFLLLKLCCRKPNNKHKCKRIICHSRVMGGMGAKADIITLPLDTTLRLSKATGVIAGILNLPFIRTLLHPCTEANRLCTVVKVQCTEVPLCRDTATPQTCTAIQTRCTGARTTKGTTRTRRTRIRTVKFDCDYRIFIRE